MTGCRPARLVSSRVVPLLGVVALTACTPGTDSAVGLAAPAGLATPVATAAPAAPKAGASAAATHKATMRKKAPVVVGFGDSVPAGGGHCSCTNFVTAYGNLIATHTGIKPTVDNFAVSGSTSADLVDQMTDSAVRAAVAGASTVLIMTGANDYDDAFDEVSIGVDPTEAYPQVATAVEDNVVTVIGKIRALNRTANVVVLDYWASMEDGAVAENDYDAPTMAASISCTASTNTALTLAAKATGSTYVSTYTAFKGSNGSKDDTALLMPDGDHPNPTGHQVIAAAIAAVYPSG
ncbi:MAG TPA: SGNH/GDSL hydrolase family protein [Sporichthyaceae bacterium]|nr:SGNH/GDSL hydrolase family protein [Sporichthyaceae bacterium]